MTHTAPAIELSNVSFQWADKSTLNDVSLRLEQGTMVGLLGSNGAGKTTLISLIAGLIAPKAGAVAIGDTSVRMNQAGTRRQLGFVFQSVSLDRFLTVKHNLEYAAGLQGLNAKHTADRIAELCELFPIETLLKRPAGALSGGQRRMVDIARAMVHNPAVLILDEPTTALDPHAKQQVWAQLVKLKVNMGKSILVATHLMDEAADCDEIALLTEGKVTWQGTPEEALNQLPDQSLTTTRKANLTDWFIWKTQEPTKPLAQPLAAPDTQPPQNSPAKQIAQPRANDANTLTASPVDSTANNQGGDKP